jgi:hypothetical protein
VVTVPVLLLTQKESSRSASLTTTPHPLASNLTRLLPAQTVEFINSNIKNETQRVGGYISAISLSDGLNRFISSQGTTDSVVEYRRALIKTFECFAYTTDGNITKAMFISNLVQYSSIYSDVLAAAYLNISVVSENSVIAGSYFNTSSAYYVSCDYLLARIFGVNTTFSILDLNAPTNTNATRRYQYNLEDTTSNCIDTSVETIDVYYINGMIYNIHT